MAKVVVEVNSTTNIVEKIYPFRSGMTIDPEPGRYAVPNIDDFIVALGFVCDPNVTPPTFGPNPDPVGTPLSQQEAIQAAIADMAKAQANMAAALALG